MPSLHRKDQAMQWTPLPAKIRSAAAEESGSVLLETTLPDSSNHHSYFFSRPVAIASAVNPDELPRLFAQIEEALANGLYAAGFLSYECGYHFAGLELPKPYSDGLPLAWFGLYRNPVIFDHTQESTGGHGREMPLETGKRAVEITNRALLGLEQNEYCRRVAKIKDYIAAGDTYQVNFTDSVTFDTSCEPLAVYESLMRNQPVGYGAWIHIGVRHILSFSPELFFHIDGRQIVTRPMKGTMARGMDLDEDERVALRLQRDEKNRAEHVMIVDLLRNDLGRICSVASVQAKDLFTVERYETLFQMTSTILGTLRPEVGYYDIFRSLFPSGSVTGAPKLRTMQIIRELERAPRGVYTGAIGMMGPGGACTFNVPIRTLVIRDGHARMGVGGGIVADSLPQDEYRECQLKAAFLTRMRPEFQLIETLLWNHGYSLLTEHMERLESSAAYFGFSLHLNEVISRLQTLSKSFEDDHAYRIRLLLQKNGELTIETMAYRPGRLTGHVKLSSARTTSTDVFLRHKTTWRNIYDHEYAQARADGFDDVVFANEKGEITEGAISNIYIEKDGMLLTPPLSSGVLPGVYRRHLLETHPHAAERVLTAEDLKAADAIFLCNSVRGVHRIAKLCTGPASCDRQSKSG
jgi:para-aminobenzoate synthetase/4-amino-4-deoxychorismate lyase